MPSGFTPSAVAGEPDEAAPRTRWTARLPVAVIIVTLLALLVVPIVIDRRTPARPPATGLTAVLALLALVSIVLVVRLGRRLERRGRELAQSEAHERLLSDAARVLVGSIDSEQTLRRTAHLAVPAFADVCLIDVIEDDGRMRRLVSTSADPARQRLARALERFPPDGTHKHPVFDALRTGRPRLLAADSAEIRAQIAQAPEHRRMIDELAPRSILIVPLIARGRVLGAIQFVSTRADRTYEHDDVLLAEDLASRAALAFDSARLYEEAREARGEAERRAHQEAALREAAAAVSAASTVEETTRRIAESALRATRADGAFVERINAEADEVEVVAAAGEKAPPLGTGVPYADSLTRDVVETGEPRVVPRIADIARPLAGDIAAFCADCSAAVVPLIDAGEPVGALFLLRVPGKLAFRPDELQRALTFGDLATLAFHKIHMLEESERRREELLRISESRARLMRGFSHDVKNPLGAADGQLQLLEEGIAGELGAEAREGVARARRSIRTALALIEDLLGLARKEAVTFEIERTPTDVREAARTITEEYRAQAEAKGLGLDVHLPRELPVIESDTARIRQILGNLLSNALKYTAEGRITVRVEEREGGAAPGPGRWIAVDVSDTGPGIPEQRQRLLFREFTRLERGARRGAGLGLAISRRIARALGGDVTLKSAPGRGSTFTLWLPLDGAAADGTRNG